jgi:hypothetical protein
VVVFGSIPLATTYVSSTLLTAVVPNALIDLCCSANVTVVTASGISSAASFRILPALPIIGDMIPGYVPAGYGTFMLTIYGSYFTATPTINWGGIPLATTGQWNIITATIPASYVANAGTVNVTVTTSAGTSVPYVFTIGQPPPSMTSLSPSSAPVGAPSFWVYVNGTNFTPNSVVILQGVWIWTQYISPTQIRGYIDTLLIGTAGKLAVMVFVPVNGGTYTASLPFTVTSIPPSISSISPSTAMAGSAGFMMTVTGVAFTPDAICTWGNTALDTIYVSPTQLNVSVPASMVQNPGTGSIKVSMAGGTSAPVSFSIPPAPPAISGLSPAVATVGNTAFTLSISGQYFTSATTAKWGSTALATTFISQTQLTAVVPSALFVTAGTTTISVVNVTGSSTQVPFTINPAISLLAAALPSGAVGNAYSAPIHVTGGSPGYAWTVTGLPSAFSYFNTSENTLTITGTPTSSGTVSFQVSAADIVGASAGPVTFNLQVAPAVGNVHNGSLNGSYSCLMQGSNDADGTRWAIVANFQADGLGNFTNGIFDTNSHDVGSGSGVLTGSYNIGADNNGLASIKTVLTDGVAGIQTLHWALALSGKTQPAQQFRMVEVDDLGTIPSGLQATANCYLATTSAFAPSTLSGKSFVFGLEGEDNYGNLKAAVGRFSTANGQITTGFIDSALGGNATVQNDAFTAKYTAPNPASGRFTIAMNGSGVPTGFAVYIIDSTRMFLLDTTNNSGEQAGNLRTEQQASTNGAILSGPFVLYQRGAEFNLSGTTPSGYYANLMRGTGNGSGGMTVNQNYRDDSGVYSASKSIAGLSALSFDASNPGRSTFTTASGVTYLYWFNANSALSMSVGDSGALDTGWLEPQSQTIFTNAALTGNYLFGEMPLLNGQTNASVGVDSVTAGGAINAVLTTTGNDYLTWDQAASTTYAWDATATGTGSFIVSKSGLPQASCIVLSAARFACAPQSDPAPSIQFGEQ